MNSHIQVDSLCSTLENSQVATLQNAHSFLGIARGQ